MRPIGHAGYVAMPDRIEMRVVDMALQVIVVADQVFPIASLPEAPLLLGDATRASMFAMRDAAREEALDEPPALGVASSGGNVHTACR